MTLKLYVNHPASERYALACGKFLINFGVVELQTRIWLSMLDNDAGVASSWFDKSLDLRIKKIIELITASESLSASDRTVASSAWNSLNGSGRMLRNSIAHSPFVMNLSDDDLRGEPKNCGFLNRKRDDGLEELISIEEINAGIDTTKTLIEELFRIISKVKP